MNSREQILRRRIDTLEARNKLLGAILRRALEDLEFTESVGAAFAFDLSAHGHEDMLEMWQSAVRALEEAQK